MRHFALLVLPVALLAAQTPRRAPRKVVAQIQPAASRAAALVSTPKARITLAELNTLERKFDSRLYLVGSDNDPIDLGGFTRGIYLPGFGVVFTTQLSLVISPGLSPFRPTITSETKASVHERKAARVAGVKKAMEEFVRTIAMELSSMPDDEQIVVAVRLDYMKWEDTLGLPGLITAKADRKGAVSHNIKLEEQ